MPRKYKRKIGVQPRVITWTEETLAAAIVEMQNRQIIVNDISKKYGIPSRTLRRRYAKQNVKKIPLSKPPTLGYENERQLVAHIQKLEKSGFPPYRKTVRSLAYAFAEKLKIKHNFNTDTKLAGTDWLQSFLERNPILSIRQDEGLSVSRSLALNIDNKENEDSDSETVKKNKRKKEKHAKTKEITKKAKSDLIYSFNDENYGEHDIMNVDKDYCVECLDNFSNIKSKVDWIQCVMCRSWLHETCTLYGNYCNKCGRIMIIAGKMNK